MPTRPKKQTKTVVGPRRMGEGKPLFPKGAKPRKMNALDEAISQGKTLPSKNKKYPGDADVKMGPSKGKPVIRPGAKPAPLAKAPAKIKGKADSVPLPKKPSNLKSGKPAIAAKKPAKKKK